MDYIKLTLFTDKPNDLAATLTDYGLQGAEINSAADFDDFTQNKYGRWDYLDESVTSLRDRPDSVTVYITGDTQGAELCLKIGRDFHELPYKAETVRSSDWENAWKAYFKPFDVGNKLTVKPKWESYDNPDDRIVLEIDPGGAFGTGQHETTRLCLERLEAVVKHGCRHLDLGTGSGILALASLRLGAKEATICDISEDSVRTAKENLADNGLADRVTAFVGDVTQSEELRLQIGTGYDIITANIVADVIIAMAPLFRGFLAEHGVLIVSGIIEERADEVAAALAANGFETSDRFTCNGWVCVGAIN
ncbi:MAG: 50S ribosomal protein L11 methyltransferase [Oscillospiraceae bacterium]|jgi:ribosomal protein L11 methyltransferase|nr:50S ribosomal protein L11 methyltransferase [Oscillospiraceae bacterium]